MLRFPGDPKTIWVLEQDFGHDLASTDWLLDEHVGHEIELKTVGGSTYGGTLLSAGDGVVLEAGDGMRLWPRDRVAGFRFSELAEGVRSRPTLTWTIEADRRGPRPAVLSYLTEGVSWRADYALEFSPSGESGCACAAGRASTTRAAVNTSTPP